MTDDRIGAGITDRDLRDALGQLQQPVAV